MEPHLVIAAMRQNGYCIGVFIFSDYTTTTGWSVPLNYALLCSRMLHIDEVLF